MATRTWNGATADWTTDADWTPNTPADDVPAPGDIVRIPGGTVILTTNTTPTGAFDNAQVTLGGTPTPTLLLRNTEPIGRYFSINVSGAAKIEADGKRYFGGSIAGSPDLTIQADPGGELIFTSDANFTATGYRVAFAGAVTFETSARLAGHNINDGTLSILASSLYTAQMTGAGTIRIGLGGSLEVAALVAATQTISFDGPGATLRFDYNEVPNLQATITNFAPGDDLAYFANGGVTSATLDTANHTLTIGDGQGGTTVVNNFYAAAGTLAWTHDTTGRDTIYYASAGPALKTSITTSARAIHADTANAMTVPGTTTRITGAGVKVGIISDSYNLDGGAAADAAAGYLPAAGTTILTEGTLGARNEGRAMAELIHQVAPDARLYFSSSGPTVESFAASVRALQAAGCTVIVDDIGYQGQEPFFQLGSPLENAITDAIAAGVTYVTAAGNAASTYYQHAFAPTLTTLYDGATVQAMTFGNGTPYQSIAASAVFQTIELQWDAPFYGVGGTASDQPWAVGIKVFDGATNALIATSTQVRLGGHLVAETEVRFPNTFNGNSTYNIAIYRIDTTTPISQIKYLILPSNTVSGPINDPDAGIGSGQITGHQLVPGAIVTAAVNVAETPALGRTLTYDEAFSSTGPGTLLFDPRGNRLATPVTAGSPDVTGPDGTSTSVKGFEHFIGTSAAAPTVAGVAALMQQVNPGITPASIADIIARTATPVGAEPTAKAGTGLVQADAAILLEEQIACYCAGTLIETDDGRRPVEALVIGDVLRTASGALRPIRWIGTRSYSSRFLWNRPHLLPVRFRRGSLADDLPRRDLLVSPLHAMLIDGLLIPAERLVNHTSITQDPSEGDVHYVHMELDTHDAILAEGAPSETFVDDNSRGMFHNAADYHARYPEARRTPAIYCAPRIEHGPQLEAIRQRHRARAEGAQDPTGPLEGHLDHAVNDRLVGWARDTATDHPVWLQIFDNGQPIALISASQPRPDVHQAGRGAGRSGFDASLGALAPNCPHHIQIRRATDQALLAETNLPAANPQSSPPQVHSTLDRASRTRLEGWAQDPADPSTPVTLDVLVNDALYTRLVANRFRPDLLAAGIGTGHHAFTVDLENLPPAPLALHVRHARDHAPLANSPSHIAAAQAFDPALQTAIDAAITALDTPEQKAEILSFITAQADRLIQRHADAPSGRRSALRASPRALVIDERLPRPGHDAGSNAILSHIAALQSLGYDVSLTAASERDGPTRALTAQGITCCTAPLYSSVEDVLRRQSSAFDVVYLHRAAIAARYLALARAHQPRARILYAVADLHHLRLERQAIIEDRPALLAASRRIRLEELTATWLADATITHSSAEAQLLRHAVPEAAIHHIPWHVPARPTPALWADRAGLAFIGSYGHAPNTDAARWLVETIMPLIWQTHPGLPCHLVGTGMPPAIRALARPGIEVHGDVEHLATVLGRVRLTAAPLRFGAGLKGKVLDSLAAGVPCAMTPTAAEGMDLPPTLSHLVADDAPALAALIRHLHDDQPAHHASASAGLSWIEQTFAAPHIAGSLAHAIHGHAARAASA